MKIIKIKNIVITFIIALFSMSCYQAPNDYYIKTSVKPSIKAIKVAVISENKDSFFVTSAAHRVLITELLDVGFTVIERNNLDQIIKEQWISSEITSNNNQDEITKEYVLDKELISKIGKMLGVDKLILVYVIPDAGNKISLSTIRMVETSTAEVITSTTIHAPLQGKDIDLLMKQAAVDMMYAYKNGIKVVRNKLSAAHYTGREQKLRTRIDN